MSVPFSCIMNAANTLRADVPSRSTRPHTPTLTLMNLEPMSRPLCLCRQRDQPEIQHPSCAVEFGVGGRDLAFAVDLEDIDTLDQFTAVGATGAGDGDPAPCDFGAAAEDIQVRESERGLCGRAGDESINAREGNCSLLRMTGYIS
jgi:hypothetical protein